MDVCFLDDCSQVPNLRLCTYMINYVDMRVKTGHVCNYIIHLVTLQEKLLRY